MVSVVDLSSSAAGQLYRVGQRITFGVQLSETVGIDATDGAPSLGLSNGATATYDPAASTPSALSFAYTIGAGQDVFDLLVTSFDLNEARITAVADSSSLDLNGFDQLAGLDTHISIASPPPSAPVITSAGGLTNQTTFAITGTGDPGDTVMLIDNSIATIGSVVVNGSGTWSMQVNLANGQHSLTAAQTDQLHTTSNASAPVSYTVDTTAPDPAPPISNPQPPSSPPPPDIAFTDVSSGTSGSVASSSYSGPVSYLEHEFMWNGTGSVAITASAANSFVHGGAGDDALKVVGGSNVLDGGAGSNFLIGGSGADGGVDSFFTDARGGAVTWSTIINFHAGDYATLWGFDPSVTTWHWEGVAGVAGFTGATLRADVHGTGTTDASMTFAGLSLEQAEALEITTGSAGSTGYMLLHNQGV